MELSSLASAALFVCSSVGCVHVSYNRAKEGNILLTGTRMENDAELVRGALLL